MGRVSAASTVLVSAELPAVLDAVADYRTVRAQILPPDYGGYQVLQGGRGAGTVAAWRLQARDVRAEVDVAGHTVIEKDANSSMVTNWTVAPAGPGCSVTVKTSWTGAGGLGGVFDRAFGPLRLKRIQAQLLANLKQHLESGAGLDG